jgi:hypothetical protein
LRYSSLFSVSAADFSASGPPAVNATAPIADARSKSRRSIANLCDTFILFSAYVPSAFGAESHLAIEERPFPLSAKTLDRRRRSVPTSRSRCRNTNY